MRFLTLRRKALVTLKSGIGKGSGGPAAALEIHRDEGVSVPTVLRNNLRMPQADRTTTHFFHYEHMCRESVSVDVWLSERDMPDADGDHLVCPVCGLVGLRVVTVPQ